MKVLKEVCRMDDFITQIENELKEHGERVLTLEEFVRFKAHTFISYELEDVEDNDDLVKVVKV